MKTSTEYQQLIESRGISLHQMGIGEVALCREEAIRATDLLLASAIPILGGDVYLKNSMRIELAYANWHSDPRSDETHAQFVERSCSEAKRYIIDFPPSATTPIFTLVLDL